MTLLGDSYCEYNTDIANRLHESSIGSHDAASHRRLVADMSNRDFSLHEIQSKGPIVRDSVHLMILHEFFRLNFDCMPPGVVVCTTCLAQHNGPRADRQAQSTLCRFCRAEIQFRADGA